MPHLFLATPIYYDFSIFGWPVWCVIATAAAGVAATGGFRRPSARHQLIIERALPGVFFALCLATRSKSLWGFFYKSYYAQLDYAFIVSFAFGTGFALSALRQRHWLGKTLGACSLFTCAWLFYFACLYVRRLSRGY